MDPPLEGTSRPTDLHSQMFCFEAHGHRSPRYWLVTNALFTASEFWVQVHIISQYSLVHILECNTSVDIVIKHESVRLETSKNQSYSSICWFTGR